MKYEIRPVQLSDAPQINALRRMSGVMEDILAVPSEPIQRTEAMIAAMDMSRHHQFVAMIKEDERERVIATAAIQVEAALRMRHCGSVFIMVDRAYQRCGIGSALMGKIIELADRWLMLLRLELGVLTDNEPAIHLYEKFGFQKEGRKRMSVVRNGVYMDEYIMGRIREDKTE